MVKFGDIEFKPHPLHWIVESLMGEPSYIEKSMFGCRGCYIHGRLVLVLASRGKKPWKGVLLPTEKKYHKSLMNEFPNLIVHPILQKWLYLSEDMEEFEELTLNLVDLVVQDDYRIGIIPLSKE
ncbi:MAG: hypothetical protein SCARUB_01849 [Candidatus Scalindua rubra]|uniref:MmcQ/YjbR family DNA-binding protein n=1 Tax=Candidatus Scalindua rubra TaxID=1872076 RepID=A0A1E3XBQ3_9BACT|nr:MAG: hypothetical protein SCARUB_01849 [Candidatus Scalindua rubra]